MVNTVNLIFNVPVLNVSSCHHATEKNSPSRERTNFTAIFISLKKNPDENESTDKAEQVAEIVNGDADSKTAWCNQTKIQLKLDKKKNINKELKLNYGLHY